MGKEKKIKANEGNTRQESIRRVVYGLYTDRKKNSEREEEIRIKRIRELTKGKKIEINNSKEEPLPSDCVTIEA